MKYYTKDYYPENNPNSFLYYQYIKDNYNYYPRWFKKYDVLNSGRFIFHDSQITSYEKTDSRFILHCKGFDYINDMPFSIVFNNPTIIELPLHIEDCWILAEELYCDENGMEFHFLIEDGEGKSKEHLTVACSNVLLKYNHFKFLTKRVNCYLKMYKEIMVDCFRK